MELACGQRSKRCMCAIARTALVFGLLPPLGARGAVLRPEPSTDRLLIQFRTTPMRYVQTLYSGAVTVCLAGWKQGAELTGLVARLASDPDVGNPANPTVLPAPTPIAAPVIPPAVAKATPTPSSTSGGGGADAPWAILTLLAAGVIRVSGEQAA